MLGRRPMKNSKLFVMILPPSEEILLLHPDVCDVPKYFGLKKNLSNIKGMEKEFEKKTFQCTFKNCAVLIILLTKNH